jgi:hypothetical protein
MRSALRLVIAAALAALADCRGGPSDAEAAEVVRRYNALVTEAYRAGDHRIAVSVVGPDEARRLAGHIGARLDQQLVLDARLLELTVRGVERPGDEVVVSTDEQWAYADRRVGTGEVVGQDSRDVYAMRYHLRPRGREWIVDRIEFASPPKVGRTEVPNRADPLTMHGVETPAPGAGSAGAATGGGR